MANFVPWARPKSWTPFARTGPALDPRKAPPPPAAPAPETTSPAPETPPAPREASPPLPSPADTAEAQARSLFEQAEVARAAEHHAEMEVLRTERAALQAELTSLQAEVARMRTLSDGLVTLRSALLQEMRSHTVDLVVTTAERIAGAALRTDPTLLQTMIEDAAATLGDNLTVRVNPEDEARVREAIGDRAIKVVPDFAVRAGCVAHSATGRIDASLDTAIQALRASAEPWARG